MEHIRFNEHGLIERVDFNVDINTAQVVRKDESAAEGVNTTEDNASA